MVNLNKRRSFFATMMAAILGISTYCSPLAASAIDQTLADWNGDGVIDVFDFVLAKRESVAAKNPMQLAVSDAAGTPGETVAVDITLQGNPGHISTGVKLTYDSSLVLGGEALSYEIGEVADAEQTMVVLLPEEAAVYCDYPEDGGEAVYNGQILRVYFTIPEDAQPGAQYMLGLTNVRFEQNATLGDVSYLVQRGKITVEDPSVAKPFEPLFGIDVSHWQGDIDWMAVKESGVNYAILRAGYGRYASQVDKQFYQNYEGATAAGIPVGAYWYSYAMSPAEARLEAKACLEVIDGLSFEYPIAFDFEEPEQLALSVAECSAIIEAFCDEMEAAGYFVTLYCSSYYLTNKVSEEVRTEQDIWVAHYNVSKPSYTGAYGMWQYGCTGIVPGIAGDVDCNWCYRDYPTIIRNAGLNNTAALQ